MQRQGKGGTLADSLDLLSTLLIKYSSLISYSKTSLINQIKKPLEDINGRFIQVKFDLNTQPDTVLFSALDSFMDGISDDEEGMELKQLIKESLGSEIT